MPVFPVRHFEWQVLRTVKRGKSPPTGRALRLVPSRRTKDGSFLSALVEQGLLTRVTGTAAAPFEATYAAHRARGTRRRIRRVRDAAQSAGGRAGEGR